MEKDEVIDMDLISRQATIAKKVLLEDWTGKEYEAVLVSDIENIPSVQPEIIYCRDCKYYCHEDYGLPYCNRMTTGFYAIDLDDFCSKSERRTDG